MVSILAKMGVLLPIVALAWHVSKSLPRLVPSTSKRFHPSGPALILSWALALSVVGALAAAIASLAVGVDAAKDTVGCYAFSAVVDQPGCDSWCVMEVASDLLAKDQGSSLYQTMFFDWKMKFQYPPSSILGWDLLRWLLSFLEAEALLTRVADLLMFAALAMSGLIAAILLRGEWSRAMGTAPSESRSGTFLYLVGGILLAFLFFPLTRSLVLGQVQTGLTMLVIASLLLWSRGSPVASGALIGLCCVVKPQMGVAILWAAIRKRWGFVAGVAAVAILAFGAVGIAYGFRHFLDYLPVLQYLSRHGEAFHPNQSINGILNRVLETAEPLVWDSNGFPPYHPFVHWGTFVSGIALIAFALLWRRKTDVRAPDLGIALLLVTMASPIAWEHHYGLLLGVLALVAPSILAARPLGRATPWILGLCWLLVGQNFPFLTLLAGNPWTGIVMNNLFFGAVGILALVVRTEVSTNRSRSSPAR